MQRIRNKAALQSISGNGMVHYSMCLLEFYQAWQEEGRLFCQTELCCPDTCDDMMDVLSSEWKQAHNEDPCLRYVQALNSVVAKSAFDVQGRLIPESCCRKCATILPPAWAFLHSQSVGLVHNNNKPSNTFLVKHDRFGALCKMGDFGLAIPIGQDEEDGDQKYMPLEMLHSSRARPSGDMFSFGVMLFEMSSEMSFVVTADGHF
jgi:serine/threonine protein kinase